MTTGEETRALALLAFESMIFALQGIFVKIASQSGGLPSTQLVFLRSILQLCVVFLVMFTSREEHVTDGRLLITVPFGRAHQRGIVLLRGFFGGVVVIMYFFCVSTIPVGDAITLASMTPVYTVFMAQITMGEPIKTSHVVSILMSIVGALAIAYPSLNFQRGAGMTSLLEMGYGAGVLSSFLYAVIIVFMRRAGALGVHTSQLMLSLSVFGMVISYLTKVAAAHDFVFSEPPWRPLTFELCWRYVLPVCVVGASAMFLLNYAARSAPAGLASIVRGTTIGWGYVFQIIVFHQIPATPTIVGVVLVFCSLGLVAWERSKLAAAMSEEERDELQKSMGFSEHHRFEEMITGIENLQRSHELQRSLLSHSRSEHARSIA